MSSLDTCRGPSTAHPLESDGFRRIGNFHIEPPIFHYALDMPSAEDWLFSVYAWVSMLRSSVVMRIGKCEGPLRTRLAAYKCSLDDAMSGRLQPHTYFKGDTQPWETEGWIQYASGPDAGAIFARQVGPLSGGETPREALTRLETLLITQHNPPLCGVSRAGRNVKQQWEMRNGPAVAVSKRARDAAHRAANEGYAGAGSP